ncbi:hypothetical protein FRC11_008449 [Ceratobasidium sp. 423]|nr:hypothetical protein FRC11_008449 [Ceratobasidium sp. 423]
MSATTKPISPNLLEKLRSTGAFAATSQGTINHIILNEYLPGQGITPHQDGPAYHPVVATLTLGSYAIMEYYQYREPSPESPGDPTTKTTSGKVIDPEPILRLLLEPRSLVITHGALYTQHLHGISGAHYDIIAPSYDNLDALKEKYTSEGGSAQVISVRDIANREMLGSQHLRDRFTQLAGSTRNPDRGGEDDNVIRLERQTRASLTCRVVEKTSKAAGKLLKLR